MSHLVDVSLSPPAPAPAPAPEAAAAGDQVPGSAPPPLSSVVGDRNSGPDQVPSDAVGERQAQPPPSDVERNGVAPARGLDADSDDDGWPSLSQSNRSGAAAPAASASTYDEPPQPAKIAEFIPGVINTPAVSVPLFTPVATASEQLAAANRELKRVTAAQEGAAIALLHKSKISEGEIWAIVDSRWYEMWCNYTGFHSDSGTVKAEKAVGARPGPIDNSRLQDSEKPYALRLGINEFEDFVLITDKQWNLFMTWYGGGLPFLRPVILQGVAVCAVVCGRVCD